MMNDEPIEIIDIDYESNLIIIRACTGGKRMDARGKLTIGEIRNPNWQQDSSSFKIFFGIDKDFEQLVALRDKGIIMKANKMLPGEIRDVKITPLIP